MMTPPCPHASLPHLFPNVQFRAVKAVSLACHPRGRSALRGPCPAGHLVRPLNGAGWPRVGRVSRAACRPFRARQGLMPGSPPSFRLG